MSDCELRDAVINGKFDKTQSTPLIRACHDGNLKIVQYLISELQARVDITNVNDENCLIEAVRNHHIDVVRYLCSNCSKQRTPLYLREYDQQILDVDYECRKSGYTAFATAVLSNMFEIADILKNEGGADFAYVNKKNKVSILELALALKQKPAIKYLQKVQLNELQTAVDKK